MNVTHEFVFKHLGVAATRQKTYYDQNLKPRSYEIGDWVWRYYPPTANLKIGCGWTGPYLVVGKLSSLTYSLQKSELSPVLNISVNDMKPYEGRNQPKSWLHDSDETLASEPSNDSLGNQSDVVQASGNSDHALNESSVTSEHEDPIPHDISTTQNQEIDTPQNTQSSTNQNQEIDNPQNTQRQMPGIPIIRSRRERVFKPRQMWSPS